MTDKSDNKLTWAEHVARAEGEARTPLARIRAEIEGGREATGVQVKEEGMRLWLSFDGVKNFASVREHKGALMVQAFGADVRASGEEEALRLLAEYRARAKREDETS